MKDKKTPRIVEEVFSAMQNAPDPNPVRQASARQAFLALARRYRREQAISTAGFVRHKEWSDIPRQPGKETIPMLSLVRALIVVAALAGVATGAVYAADASLPGQLLYPADLAMEQVQMSLAVQQETQAELALRAATERADELRLIAQAGNPPDQAVLERLRVQLELAFQAASRLQQQQMVPLMVQMRDMAQEQARLMQQLGLEEGAAIMIQARNQAQAGIDDPAGFQQRQRSGQGWDNETPDSGTEPAPTVTPETQGEEATQGGDQDRVQDRDRDRTCEPGTGDCEPVQQQDRDRQQDQTRDSDQDRMGSGPADATPVGPGGSPNGTGGGQPNSGSDQGGSTGSRNGQP